MMRLGWPRSLRSRLALVVAMALTPSVLLALLQGVTSFEDAERTRSELFELRALAAVDEVRSVFAGIRPALQLIALRAAQEMEATGRCDDALGSLAKDYAWSTQGLIFNQNGEAVCGTERKISVGDFEFWPEFAAQPDFKIGNVRRGRLSGKLILLTYHPMPLAGPERFAIGVGVDLGYLQTLSHEDEDKPRFALVNQRGSIVMAEGLIGDEAAERITWLPRELQQHLRYGDRKATLTGADGRERRYYSSAIVPNQLWAITSREEDSLADVLVSAEGSAVAAPIVACLIALFAVSFASKRLILRHLVQLQANTVAFGIGERGERAARASDAPEELERLEDTLFAMGDALTEKNEMLTEMLDVQKRLLLEVHHRVKNSLQTISSLMSIEARRFTEDEGRQAFQSIQQRLYSLSMVHQNLYTASKLDHVDLGALISAIVKNSHSTLARSPKMTSPELDLEDTPVETSAATPIALFVSEAVTNAYKHGSAEDPGVKVVLKQDEERFELEISNRQRAADDEAMVEGDGLGGQLMAGFAAQLQGRYACDRQDGRYTVRLEAPLASAKPLFSLKSAAAA